MGQPRHDHLNGGGPKLNRSGSTLAEQGFKIRSQKWLQEAGWESEEIGSSSIALDRNLGAASGVRDPAERLANGTDYADLLSPLPHKLLTAGIPQVGGEAN
jgi:hypothetical protein